MAGTRRFEVGCGGQSVAVNSCHPRAGGDPVRRGFSVLCIGVSGILGRPVKPGDDSCGWKTQSRILATHCARGLLEASCPLIERAQGRPGARCTRGPVCNLHRKMRTRAYRSSGEHPAFPAQWLYGLYRALPGERAFLPPLPARSFWLPTDLTPATGRQDHTTSPYAQLPFVAATSASTATRPTSVTTADALLSRTGWR